MPFEESKEEILGTKVTKTYGFFLALGSVLLSDFWAVSPVN